jgi:hypothetical protein
MVSELVSIRLEPLIAFVVEFSKVWKRVCFMYFMIDSVHVASAAKKKERKLQVGVGEELLFCNFGLWLCNWFVKLTWSVWLLCHGFDLKCVW